METIINIDRRTFLIKFSWKPTNGTFIFQNGEDLTHLIKEHGEKGIEYIKEFSPVKNNFTRVSKADLLRCFSWETETSIFLKNHHYFKNVKL